MEMEDDFKFPDEIEAESKTAEPENNTVVEGDVEIELIDDTPLKDRNRKPLDKVVEDPTDDEIENYSDKVKSRIKELTHARHDERRVKESLAREKQELEKLTRYLSEENKKLKQTVNYGQEAFISTSKREAEAQLEAARRQIKDAQESFDSDAMIAGQEALTDAKMRLAQVNNFRPTPLQEEETPVQVQQSQPESVQPDEKSLRWQARNQWYGQPGFEEYTSYALGLHHKLVNGGIDPRNDEYFARIDERMSKTFPELFGNNGNTRSQADSTSAPTRKPASVVAPAARSSGVRKIQLTTSQLALAKKYGLTPQQYANEVAKLENANG
tara:strand:- start:425 stop:1405 length:981 start_codon:yes stop_codon:yes gene_type:complete